jgi:Tol biopolymer transport system component
MFQKSNIVGIIKLKQSNPILNMNLLRSTILYLMIFITVIGAVGCTNTTDVQTFTPSSQPTELPSPPPSPSGTTTVTTPYQTSTPTISFKNQVLLQVFYNHPTEIWTTTYPFNNVQPLFRDETYSYGMAIWSHDGEWIAYSKTALGCPTTSSSIWISRPDGSEARQVTDSIEGKINPNTEDCTGTLLHPAAPLAWSEDGSGLAIRMYGPHILSLETGEVQEIYPKDVLEADGLDSEYAHDFLGWQSFSPQGNRALLITIDIDSSPILLWTSLEDPDATFILHPPSEFNGLYLGRSDGLAWSPDGKTILVADQANDTNYLWMVNVESDEWWIVAESPIITNSDKRQALSWSLDGAWVAWWGWVAYSGTNNFAIDFISTDSWESVHKISFEINRRGHIGDWITTAHGEPRFVVWRNEPLGGIYLIDPNGMIDDEVLVTYEIIANQIPRIDGLLIGPWQP